MKKIFCTLILFFSISSVGQDGTAPGMFEDEGDVTGQGTNGGLEGVTGDTTPGAPIDNKVLYLFGLGTFYGIYSVYKNRKELN